ncbi:hypothetical protein [Neisseria sp. Ec49-e6-T10]|uniref:hypothetical protein n=1 Tax=Neisseria sp. Ec49-e6-T10 TaxID=3140744 RepID=UPI003EB7F070
MKWLLGPFLLILLFLGADFSNALWQTREARSLLSGFNIVQTAHIDAVKTIQLACPNNQPKCIQKSVTIKYEHLVYGDLLTTLDHVDYSEAQVGSTIDVLCDFKQYMCLPKAWVEQQRSVWTNMYLSKWF